MPEDSDTQVDVEAQPEPGAAELEPERTEAEEPLPSLERELGTPPLAIDGDPVTQLLYERLDAADIAEVERGLADDQMFQTHPHREFPAVRRWLSLTLGMHNEIPVVGAKTGLPAGLPPEDVHAMARGALVAAGGLYEADMVVASLMTAGVDPASVRTALDFGCSSGRVVRVLNAAYPDASWWGCDPNGPAVSWARENLPGIQFFTSSDAPPLPLADGHLDLVYAISIWSHFEPELGLRWFDEMHRVIEPGGHLMFTTHGYASIERYRRADARTLEQSLEIRDALYSAGAWYAAEFGEEGDWGVVNPLWGTAFLSPEWVLAKLTPRWRVLAFGPGRNDSNQDVYVLERV